MAASDTAIGEYVLTRCGYAWSLSIFIIFCLFFFFQAEDGIRDLVRSRGLGDVYKRQDAKYAKTAQSST